MMTLAAFSVAALALLCTPGPTNTLVGLAGARQGVARALRLIPAELGGYLTAIVPLALAGEPLFRAWPSVAVGLKVLAAAWVMFLALRLWTAGAQVSPVEGVSARRVYVTTMLNPKALVVALVLLPAATNPQFTPRLALFCALVTVVAAIWGSAGALARCRGDNRMRLIQRVASVWLAIVSGGLAVSALGA